MERESRIEDQIEPLWDKLAELKRLEASLSRAKTCGDVLSSEKIRAEIEKRLGFFPPLFMPALEVPSLLQGLWRQQLACYYDNPLPELFKEKLSVRLSRYAASPYFIIVHSCMLYQLGLRPREIRKHIESPSISAAILERTQKALACLPHPMTSWPASDPEFEENLISCCMAIFLEMPESAQCTSELKSLMGPDKYAYLVALLAGIKASHLWLEAHPEVDETDHPVVRSNLDSVIRSEPVLAEKFANHKQEVARIYCESRAREAVLESESRYRELVENASDIICSYDFNGKILSANRALERITGYRRDEAFEMRITDFIAPEYRHLGQRILDPEIAGEMPLNHELEIISKDGNRVALSINTRPIFRGGRAIAVQGIARDITARRKTEAALQEANQKLEAWVNELEQRTREMTLLNEMGDILRACLTTEEAYHVIVRVAQQIFPVRVGALYVIAPSRNVVEAVAVWGDPSLIEYSFSPQECWGLRRGRTHWIDNVRSGLICRHVDKPSAHGYMCIPMMAQSEALGVLHLMQPDDVRMTETKQRIAVTMSEHIAMALSNLKLHETLRSQSIRDPLTGLFNRRFMEESLELEIRRASRNQRPLGMIMIDLDHFKYFNDTFGHEAGDLLLKELGILLRGNIRGEDIACRYGGEEFTLILPEGTGTVTMQRAEFFREAIQRLSIQYRGRPLGKITASMGVAVFPDHGRTAESLINAADKALYRSKAAGRDCVTLAG